MSFQWEAPENASKTSNFEVVCPYLAVNSSKLSSECVLRLLLHPTNFNGTPPFTGNSGVRCARSKLDAGVRVARRRRVVDDMGSWAMAGAWRKLGVVMNGYRGTCGDGSEQKGDADVATD